jgi:hypothetical protein
MVKMAQQTEDIGTHTMQELQVQGGKLLSLFCGILPASLF